LSMEPRHNRWRKNTSPSATLWRKAFPRRSFRHKVADYGCGAAGVER
jgi:hypothetical protein